MPFKTLVHTCNPVRVHTFSWTIENITRVVEQLKGPTFTPIPNRSDAFRFDFSVKKFDQNFTTEYFLEVYLNIQTKDQAFNFSCDVTLCNADAKILTSAKSQFMEANKNTCLVNKVLFTRLRKAPGKYEFFDLPEDKLILKAIISISGYDIVPEIVKTTVTNCDCNSELLDDLRTMFESGTGHDVTFSVNGELIPAHTLILCSRSPVFAKMFQTDMLEKSSKNVVIEDSNLEIFKLFLLYLYTGNIEQDDWETAISLYSLADKYEVKSLRRDCFQMLTEWLSIASVCRILALADLHSDEKLKEIGKIFFRKNFSRVIQTSEWGKLVNTKPQLASEVLESVKDAPKISDPPRSNPSMTRLPGGTLNLSPCPIPAPSTFIITSPIFNSKSRQIDI